MLLSYNATASTEIYTLSLHDALPILGCCNNGVVYESENANMNSGNVRIRANRATGELEIEGDSVLVKEWWEKVWPEDRKSTRLNCSHANISYAVFCLKKNSHVPSLCR